MRSRRGFFVLLGVTLLMVAAAIVSQRSFEEPQTRLGLLFPDLGEQVDRIRTVRIETSDGALILARNDGGWVAENKTDYPADAGRVRELVLGISRLERLERKTDDPDRYASLELTDIDREDSKAVRVSLLDDDGAELAAVLLGKTRDFQSGGRSRYFVRIAGDARSWLVEGSLPPVPEDFRNWLQQSLLPGVEKSDFQTLRVDHADGETVEIVNHSAGRGSDFRISGLQDDEKVSSQQAVDAVAGTLRGLALEDVEQAGTGGDSELTVTATTVDGVLIVARFSSADRDYEVRLEARYDPEDGRGNDDTGDERLAEDLNRRWAGRKFLVSEYAVNALKVRRADLVGESATD